MLFFVVVKQFSIKSALFYSAGHTICQGVKINARGYLTAFCFGFNDIREEMANETKKEV